MFSIYDGVKEGYSYTKVEGYFFHTSKSNTEEVYIKWMEMHGIGFKQAL
jgi:hypothetical protein